MEIDERPRTRSGEVSRLARMYDFPDRWLGGDMGDAEREKRADLIVNWERIGLNAEGLFVHLLQAVYARLRYEEERRAVVEWQRTGNRRRRGKLQVLDGAERLFKVLSETKGTVPDSRLGGLLEELEVLVVRRREELLTERKLPKHRPGELWREPHVLMLAEHLRGANQSWRRTVRIIFDGFDVVGLGDVVKEEGVRHILRSAKRRYPDFRGPLKFTRCRWCTGDRGLGRAIEDVRIIKARVGQKGLERLMQNASSKRLLREYRRKIERLLRKLPGTPLPSEGSSPTEAKR
jgi:hypothetical protein